MPLPRSAASIAFTAAMYSSMVVGTLMPCLSNRSLRYIRMKIGMSNGMPTILPSYIEMPSTSGLEKSSQSKPGIASSLLDLYFSSGSIVSGAKVAIQDWSR